MELGDTPKPGADTRSLRPLAAHLDETTCARMLAGYVASARESIDAARDLLTRWRAGGDRGMGADILSRLLDDAALSSGTADCTLRATAALRGIELPARQ